jgi:hypothetical protein
MRRLVFCALVALTACGGSTTPVTPTPTIVTDTFTNNTTPLAPNGAFSYSFSTTTSGTVTATLTSVLPDATKVIGFQMGIWTAATNTCTAVQSNDAALQGAVFTATASTAGTYCVRVYDIGQITADAPVTFVVTVSHP